MRSKIGINKTKSKSGIVCIDWKIPAYGESLSDIFKEQSEERKKSKNIVEDRTLEKKDEGGVLTHFLEWKYYSVNARKKIPKCFFLYI